MGIFRPLRLSRTWIYSRLGFKFFTPYVGGILAFSNASMALITAVKPLAASEWPTLVLTCIETVSSTSRFMCMYMAQGLFLIIQSCYSLLRSSMGRRCVPQNIGRYPPLRLGHQQRCPFHDTPHSPCLRIGALRWHRLCESRPLGAWSSEE